jgi:hypothetical protein
MAIDASPVGAKRLKPGIGLWVAWLTVITVCWAAQAESPFWVLLVIQKALPTGLVIALPIIVTIWVVCASITGFLQWIMIRRYAAISILWIATNLLGLIGGAIAALGVQFIVGQRFMVDGVLIVGLVGGWLLGIFQWVILRRKVRHAIWWVAAHILGWTAGSIPYGVVGVYLAILAARASDPNGPIFIGRPLTFVIIIIRDIWGPVIAGGITGLALVMLLRQIEYPND